MTPRNWGATPEEWYLFASVYGLQEDLLPVVSNPDAPISPTSSLQSAGKTPSRYNGAREVVGIADWPRKRSTATDIARWQRESDYGISVICRNANALDIDVADRGLAETIQIAVETWFLTQGLPIPAHRYRSNSGKSLYMVSVPGEEISKTVIPVEGGIVEFLGARQQFIACGTHTSGARYEWRNLENGPVELTLDQFNDLIAMVQQFFAVEKVRKERQREEGNLEDLPQEEIFQRLSEKGMIKSKGRDGSYNIVCPFSEEHTTESAESSTIYYPAHTGGYSDAAIKCLHAHCAERSTLDFRVKLGSTDDPAEDFDDLTNDEPFEPPPPPEYKPDENRFQISNAITFAESGEPPEELIEDFMPKRGVCSLYGPAGSGKTFAALDIAASVARGLPWNGHDVAQGPVVYICAEGSYFFKNRIKAYAKANKIDNPDDLPIGIIEAKPDFMSKKDTLDLAAAIKAQYGDSLALIIIDTFAVCMTGDENSGVDIGKVFKNFARLQAALGGNVTILFLHHSGKDTARGARGNSRIRNDVDLEVEVFRDGNDRSLVVRKLKDGADGGEYPFKLQTVEVGTNAKGKIIESCVVEYPQGDVVASIRAKRGLTMRERTAYQALEEFHMAGGGWPTVDAMRDLVSYLEEWSPKQVRTVIGSLVNKGLVEVDREENEKASIVRLVDITRPDLSLAGDG